MISRCRAAGCTCGQALRLGSPRTVQPIISIPGHYPRSGTYAVFNCEWSLLLPPLFLHLSPVSPSSFLPFFSCPPSFQTEKNNPSPAIKVQPQSRSLHFPNPESISFCESFRRFLKLQSSHVHSYVTLLPRKHKNNNTNNTIK